MIDSLQRPTTTQTRQYDMTQHENDRGKRKRQGGGGVSRVCAGGLVVKRILERSLLYAAIHWSIHDRQSRDGDSVATWSHLD